MKKGLNVISIFILTAAVIVFSKPPGTDLKFSHKYHIVEVEVECSDCHSAADTSLLSTDNLLPDHKTCSECHEIEDNCKLCHKNEETASAVPRIQNYIANFPHIKHKSDKLSCEKCHSRIKESESIAEKHLPKMSVCTDCHNDVSRTDYCFTCHSKGENLTPPDHELAWKKQHGIASYMSSNNCAECHTKNFCIDCHRKDNLDHKTHPLNYVNIHGIYAKGNKDNCYTCHEELSFCIDCHRQKMVMPRNHASANWSNRTTGGAHARAAKLDLDSCIGCHSDINGNPVCIECHESKK
ncbi:hypothetical protein DRQ09_04065 [candidate division KSB1 bacterium]|nr:MAG: hypothetical protein DRQ09_04065 [candidate division KSB1 bacterium]